MRQLMAPGGVYTHLEAGRKRPAPRCTALGASGFRVDCMGMAPWGAGRVNAPINIARGIPTPESESNASPAALRRASAYDFLWRACSSHPRWPWGASI